MEILAAIYFLTGMDREKIKRMAEDRDRVVLSKGHGALALYEVLASAGIIAESEIDGFSTIKGKLGTHPEVGTAAGLEMTAGSLGQGLAFACGAAMACKMKGGAWRTYVITGDGELQEGSNWEAMLLAAQQKLETLTLVVDRNGMQISGRVDDIITLNPLRDKLEAFGFHTVEANGHDLAALQGALAERHEGKPLAVIANTVKGKGISFIEGQNGWHGKGLTREQYDAAIKELEAEA